MTGRSDGYGPSRYPTSAGGAVRSWARAIPAASSRVLRTTRCHIGGRVRIAQAPVATRSRALPIPFEHLLELSAPAIIALRSTPADQYRVPASGCRSTWRSSQEVERLAVPRANVASAAAYSARRPRARLRGAVFRQARPARAAVPRRRGAASGARPLTSRRPSIRPASFTASAAVTHGRVELARPRVESGSAGPASRPADSWAARVSLSQAQAGDVGPGRFTVPGAQPGKP